LQSFFASQDEFKGGFVEKYTAIRELGDLWLGAPKLR